MHKIELAMISILVISGLIFFGIFFVTVKSNAEYGSIDIIDSAGNNNSNPSFAKTLHYLYEQENSLLSSPATSVMNKTQLPASGDRHDFLDLKPYCWPDSESPNGLPYICDDSRGINPEFYAIPDYMNMQDMISHVKTLSLAYHFSGNESYGSKAANLIRVWFLNSDTKMNPNLQYTELIRGENSGTPHGIIAGKDFPELLESIGLIEKSASWNNHDEQGIKKWFSSYLDWLLNSTAGIKEGKSKNNHGTWYNVQVSGIAAFLNKKNVTKSILNKTMAELFAVQILPDGKQPLELKRPTGLDYSLFNLFGLFKLASIGEHVGIDMWNYETSKGAGLRKALDYLIPYISNKSTWPYKQEGPIDMRTVVNILQEAATHYPDNDLYKQAYGSIERKYVIANTDTLAKIVQESSFREDFSGQ